MRSKDSLQFVSVVAFTLSLLATHSSLLRLYWCPTWCFQSLFIPYCVSFFISLFSIWFHVFFHLVSHICFIHSSQETGVLSRDGPGKCGTLLAAASVHPVPCSWYNQKWLICFALLKKLEAIIDFIKPEILSLIDSCNSVRKATSLVLICECSGMSFWLALLWSLL